MTSETGRAGLFVARLSLVALVSLAGCHGSPELVVLSGDRTTPEVPCAQHSALNAQHCYEVSEIWMQERYQLERALRLRLERCEAPAVQENGTK